MLGSVRRGVRSQAREVRARTTAAQHVFHGGTACGRVRRPRGHCIAINRKTGEDYHGDRDCVLGARVYGLRGQNGDHVSSGQRWGGVSSTINAAGEKYKQRIEFLYLSGAISADRTLDVEITRRLQRAWVCVQRYKMEIYDRPGVRLRLKVRMLSAWVIEALLYGCVTWSPNKADNDTATTASPFHASPMPRMVETEAR